MLQNIQSIMNCRIIALLPHLCQGNLKIETNKVSIALGSVDFKDMDSLLYDMHLYG